MSRDQILAKPKKSSWSASCVFASETCVDAVASLSRGRSSAASASDGIYLGYLPWRPTGGSSVVAPADRVGGAVAHSTGAVAAGLRMRRVVERRVLRPRERWSPSWVVA